MHETASSPVSFEAQFAEKAAVVRQYVGAFAVGLRNDAAMHGPHMGEAMESYVQLLERSGKGSRGALAITGYELFGGSPDDEVIGEAAAVMEAEHVYLLVLDDVADAADRRRNGPTAHVHMERHLALYPRASHIGVHDIAENVAITAATDAHCKAQNTLLSVNAPIERVVAATKALNNGLSLTAKGQVLDILSAVRTDMDIDEIKQIATYKTAYYSYLLPLQIGGILAGASAEEVQVFEQYALHAGLAYQLRDDINIYGDEGHIGKPAKSDIVEGKKTLLYMSALSMTEGREHRILECALGLPTLSDEQFTECLNLIEACGARQYAQDWAEYSAQQAVEALQSIPGGWPAAPIQFLQDMALYGAHRSK